MNSAKKRLIAVISLIALTLTGCGMMLRLKRRM